MGNGRRGTEVRSDAAGGSLTPELDKLIQLRQAATPAHPPADPSAEHRYSLELTYRAALYADDFHALRRVLDGLVREVAAARDAVEADRAARRIP